MRKNGVNKKLSPISGGVCAPAGFKASGVYCEIGPQGKPDFAMVLADRRCPTACVYSTSEKTGAPIAITKRHLKRNRGLAQAIIANSGSANVFLNGGERMTEDVCIMLETRAFISRDDIVVASTGKIDGKVKKAKLEAGAYAAFKALEASETASENAANAIATFGHAPMQVSYSFDLGDYPCRIGAIFKGDMHVGPNMATTLAFLTTDVNITPTALEKVLSTAIRDTMNMLSLDGAPSPNDLVCIIANGKAGNYRIDAEDTEYKKFLHALRSVLTEICRKIILSERHGDSALYCTVKGAKSKQAARAFALDLVKAQVVRRAFSCGVPDVEGIVYQLLDSGADIDANKLQIEIASEGGELTLFDCGQTVTCGEEYLKSVLSEREVEMTIRLWRGNYSATAFGCFQKK